MRGQGRVDRELEELLQDQEEAADAPTNRPRLPSPPEEAVDKPEDRPGLAPPPVEPAHTPVIPDERWKLLKFMRRR